MEVAWCGRYNPAPVIKASDEELETWARIFLAKGGQEVLGRTLFMFMAAKALEDMDHAAHRRARRMQAQALETRGA
jgi:hypothetical protein